MELNKQQGRSDSIDKPSFFPPKAYLQNIFLTPPPTFLKKPIKMKEHASEWTTKLKTKVYLTIFPAKLHKKKVRGTLTTLGRYTPITLL